MNTSRHDGITCPKCGLIMQCSTNFEEGRVASPQEGDVSVCIGCGAINKYEANLTLVATTTEEENKIINEMMSDKDRFILMTVRKLVAEKAKKKEG